MSSTDKAPSTPRSSCFSSVCKKNPFQLHWACSVGDVETTRKLLSKKSNYDEFDNNGKSPLMLAAEEGHADCVRELLRYPVNLNARNHDGDTSLHLAASEHRYTIAQLLIGAGADLRAQNKEGWMPLHTAVTFNDYDIAKMLLQKGSPVDPLDENKQTPLMTAASYGYVNIIKLLLNFGADVHLKSVNDQNAEDMAVINNHEECAKLIEEYLDNAAKGPEDENDLFDPAFPKKDSIYLTRKRLEKFPPGDDPDSLRQQKTRMDINTVNEKLSSLLATERQEKKMAIDQINAMKNQLKKTKMNLFQLDEERAEDERIMDVNAKRRSKLMWGKDGGYDSDQFNTIRQKEKKLSFADDNHYRLSLEQLKKYKKQSDEATRSIILKNQQLMEQNKLLQREVDTIRVKLKESMQISEKLRKEKEKIERKLLEKSKDWEHMQEQTTRAVREKDEIKIELTRKLSDVSMSSKELEETLNEKCEILERDKLRLQVELRDKTEQIEILRMQIEEKIKINATMPSMEEHILRLQDKSIKSQDIKEIKTEQRIKTASTKHKSLEALLYVEKEKCLMLQKEVVNLRNTLKTAKKQLEVVKEPKEIPDHSTMAEISEKTMEKKLISIQEEVSRLHEKIEKELNQNRKSLDMKENLF